MPKYNFTPKFEPLPTTAQGVAQWTTSFFKVVRTAGIGGIFQAEAQAFGQPMTPAVLAEWAAEGAIVHDQATTGVLESLRTAAGTILDQEMINDGHDATPTAYLQGIVAYVNMHSTSAYTGVQYDDTRYRVDTTGCNNADIVTAIWQEIADLTRQYQAVGGVQPLSHWLTFATKHLEATGLWLSEMDGMTLGAMKARAMQTARSRDNRKKQPVAVNYTQHDHDDITAYPAVAKGTFNCDHHGRNATHDTDGCNFLKRQNDDGNGGGGRGGNGNGGGGGNSNSGGGRGGTRGGGGGNGGGKCHECHQPGHVRRQCPQIVCRQCKKKGHIAIDCKESAANVAELVAAAVADQLQQQQPPPATASEPTPQQRVLDLASQLVDALGGAGVNIATAPPQHYADAAPQAQPSAQHHQTTWSGTPTGFMAEATTTAAPRRALMSTMHQEAYQNHDGHNTEDTRQAFAPYNMGNVAGPDAPVNQY
jgi:hypothetical protein